MKNFLSAWSVLILGLSITTFLFLAGCGGLNATSPAPTPNPFQPSPTPTSPHGTFVYVNSSANRISKTTGYRLNPDGTLTALAGSPILVRRSIPSRLLADVFRTRSRTSKLQPVMCSLTAVLRKTWRRRGSHLLRSI